MGMIKETLMAVAPSMRALQEGPLPLTAGKVIEWLGGEPTSTGFRITPEQALRQSAVYACVRAISEDVASLPLITYKRLEHGKDRAVAHPIFPLLHDAPNPHMTAMQFREMMQAHLLLRGNAYAHIERDEDGRVLALWPLHPDRMEPPVLSQAGTLLYTYRPVNGGPVALTQSEVLHLRGLSPDGIMGYSPITLHRETLGNAEAMLQYGASFFGNQSQPGGYLAKKDGQINEDVAKRLRESWEAGGRGKENWHRVRVLEEGLEWHQIALSNEDSQYLDSRKFSRSEIAGIFRVPPHKIGDLERATFSNIEEQAIEYVTDTLQSWLVRWEQQVNKDLLSPTESKVYFVEHLLDAKLRGKTLERMQSYQLGIQNGIYSPNDVLEMENRNPFEGGDLHLQPMNFVPWGTEPQPTTSGEAV